MTFENVESLSVVVTLEHTPIPIYTLAAIVILRLDPICVHVVPLGERYILKVFPVRVTRTQYGARFTVDPVVWVVAPPVLDRCFE